MLYCKRQQGHYGTEKLKTEKIDKVILSKEQWENETGKIKLLELWNCISFENNMKCGNIEALVLIAMYLKEAATGSFLRFYRKS